MAEAHPVGFQWVMEAKRRGRHGDPRRPAVHPHLRGGRPARADPGGHRHRVPRRPDPPRAGDRRLLRGLRAGLHQRPDAGPRRLRRHRGPGRGVLRLRPGDRHLRHQLLGVPGHARRGGHRPVPPRRQARGCTSTSAAQIAGSGGAPIATDPERDDTLQDPRCVFQVLRRHFARYTPEMVHEICGIPPETFAAGRRRADAQLRPGAHQRVLLRGRLDPPHGGRPVHPRRVDPAGAAGQHRPPRRRHPRAARARQHPGLHRHPDAVRHAARLHPDAARAPRAGPATPSSRPTPARRASGATSTPTWSACSRPGSATRRRPENDFCFDHLPRLTGDHSTFHTVRDQIDGKVPGYFVIGENPAVGTANARQQRHGLANLEWLVVRDLHMIETATFWKDGPEIATGEQRTEDIGTEVFFLPAAAHTEKDGTFTNTQRLLQWHHKAVEPPGDCRSDLWFYYELGRRIKAAAGRLHRSARPPAAGPDLGLPGRRQRRAERGRGPARDQRHRAGRQGAQRLHRAEGRRLHRPAAAGSTAASTPTRSTRPCAASPARSRTTSRTSGAGRGR